ncbi:DNA polymerase Y family protein [Aminipila butyrica]
MDVLHIDANAAYLSWTAVELLEKGCPIDIRTVPSVIAGDPENRHGIILAKSIPAKKYGIKTGESLFEAKNKCPSLLVFPPDYDLYMCCSNAMYQILLEYSPLVERYSIDECFLDYTASHKLFGSPVAAAHAIKNRIKTELGYTVNVGVSSTKVLAKMAGELKKPNLVHTLWPEEIPAKMWPLPIGALFMVGHATKKKLESINIRTIGELAQTKKEHMKALLKSHGLLVWNLANGIDDSPVTLNSEILQKSVGNSTTIDHDVTDRTEAHIILLALTERVAMRLRKLGYLTSVVSVSIKNNSFMRYTHQLKLSNSINSTTEIYENVCRLFDQSWKGEPLRHLGVHVSDFQASKTRQICMFDRSDSSKLQDIDKAVDKIRARYGTRAIIRGSFVNGSINPIQGGVNDSEYIMMGGYEQ